MPQRLRATYKWPNFDFGVSYRTNAQDKMRDAANVYSNQSVLRTRNGIQRFNATAVGSGVDLKSVSFFKKADGTRKYIVKGTTDLYDMKETGSHTTIKTGLTNSNKHRSVAFSDRAILAIESDGLFAWNGTTFSQLGQAPPTAPTIAKNEGSGTLPNAAYQVAITYYSTTLGFESNIGVASNTITTDGGNDSLDVTAIVSTATNSFIDKVRVYIKDITNASEWLFWGELSLGTTTDNIDESPTSTQIPPTKNAAPLSGGGKFLAIFGKKLVYSGSEAFPNDVFFSEPYLPDAFDNTDSRVVINAQGEGKVTGLGVGLYNNDNLNPYLAIFKKRSIEVYSELGGIPSISLISTNIGSISHDTITQIAGDIYFMSESGWYVIANGKIIENNSRPFRLADGDLDSIFTEKGYTYEINKTATSSFFSIYEPVLKQYITFVSEGGNNEILRAYNYELDIAGFRPYNFKLSFTGATIAEDSGNESFVLMVGKNGRAYKHSINVTKHDVDADNNSIKIDAFAQLYWIAHKDMDATMNFGTMALKALSNENDLVVKYFLNYEVDDPTDQNYSFDVADTGFILDLSVLDEGILGDGRTIVRQLSGGVYRTAQSLLIGFYQSVIDSDIGLLEGQLDASKNGNSNSQ